MNRRTRVMTKLYEDTMREIKSGEIVTGRIVSHQRLKTSPCDIGFKSEGTVPMMNLKTQPVEHRRHHEVFLKV